MGLLTDILKEIPQAAVLKEKIASIEAKYAAADTENAILKDDLRKANAEIRQLKKQVEELSHKDDLDQVELQLLHRIANLDYDDCVPPILSQGLNLSKARFEYHLQRLEDFDYAETGLIDDAGIHYSITQRGREVLLRNNLL